MCNKKMEEEKEKIWVWLMPSGKIYKVVTNQGDGTIRVYNPNGELVRKDEKLSKAAVSLIEQNFLGTVATMVEGKGMGMETKKDLTDEIGIYIR
jgi:WD40 repeat protein